MSTRYPTIARVLHAVEASAYTTEAQGVTAHHLTQVTGLGETTVRKALAELQERGFVARNGARGRAWVYRAVRKHDQHEEEQPMPDPETNQRVDAVNRDADVLQALPATVDELAAKLKIKRSLAYVSVWRLARRGAVVKRATGSRTPVWEVAPAGGGGGKQPATRGLQDLLP